MRGRGLAEGRLALQAQRGGSTAGRLLRWQRRPSGTLALPPSWRRRLDLSPPPPPPGAPPPCRYSDDVALEDAIHTALLTLKEGFEGSLSGGNIEVRG